MLLYTINYTVRRDTVLTENEYYGGLREDAKRIYFTKDGTETLIYDFNLSVGDSFPSEMSGEYFKVSMIDSVSINGQFRKRYAFVNNASGTPVPWSFGSWIEGIGNSGIGGLLRRLAWQPTCDCSTDNLCVKLDNSWIYHNPKYAGSGCVSTLALRDPAAGKQAALIVPNPVTDISRLRIEGDVKFDRAEVFDGRGLKVRSYTGSAKNTILIDRKEYTPGLYLYRLSVSGQVIGAGKFVVR